MSKCSFMMVLAAVSLVAWSQEVQAQSAEGRDASVLEPCTDLNRMLGTWQLTTVTGAPSYRVTVTSFDPTNCNVMQVWDNPGPTGNTNWLITAYSNETHDWVFMGGGTDMAGGTTAYASRWVNGRLMGGRHLAYNAMGDEGSPRRLVFTFRDDGTIFEYFGTSSDGGMTWTKDGAFGPIWERVDP